MAQAFADESSPNSLEDQLCQNGLVIHPNWNRNYQCERCMESFPCHEPYQYHASKHGETIPHIYVEFKQSASLTSNIIAFHGVYCRHSTHYVRVTISKPLGPTSTIQRIDEEEELAFKEFLKKDFSPTEMYKEIVGKMEEFNERCCKPNHDLTILSPKTLVNWLRSCFACIPTLRRPRSRRWSSISNSKSTPRYLSKEALTANNRHDLVADDSMSTTNTVLPGNITAVIAVQSFYSTSEGVRGYGVLVATRSSTVILLQRVNLGEILLHTRIMNQLREIIGDYAYNELLEYEKKRMDVLSPVYQGILPDDLPIGVGEEIRLEDCSPVFEAQVCSALDS